MYPDGVETEQSSGYHFVAFRQFDGFLQTAKALRTLPPAFSEIRGIVEKMANYTACKIVILSRFACCPSR